MLGPSRFSTSLSIVLITGVLFALQSTAQAVADSSARQLIKTVSYTTSPKSDKLVWLPYRPTSKPVEPEKENKAVEQPKGEANSAEPLVHHVEAPALIKPAQHSTEDRFQDPFGDTRPAAELAPPKRLPLGGVLPVQQLQDLAAPKNQPVSEPEVLPTPAPKDSVDELPGVKIREGEQMAVGPALGPEACPTAKDLKPITEITHDTSIKETGQSLPEEQECDLVDVPYRGRRWVPITYHWKAPGTCHKPLYFEDVNLERYGHSWGPYIQPVISGGRFFLTVPALPYLMGMDPPTECVYTLGYYRPGSCAPYKLDPIPLSVRGAIAAGGVYTGMVYLIP